MDLEGNEFPLQVLFCAVPPSPCFTLLREGPEPNLGEQQEQTLLRLLKQLCASHPKGFFRGNPHCLWVYTTTVSPNCVSSGHFLALHRSGHTLGFALIFVLPGKEMRDIVSGAQRRPIAKFLSITWEIMRGNRAQQAGDGAAEDALGCLRNCL